MLCPVVILDTAARKTSEIRPVNRVEARRKQKSNDRDQQTGRIPEQWLQGKNKELELIHFRALLVYVMKRGVPVQWIFLAQTHAMTMGSVLALKIQEPKFAQILFRKCLWWDSWMHATRQHLATANRARGSTEPWNSEPRTRRRNLGILQRRSPKT